MPQITCRDLNRLNKISLEGKASPDDLQYLLNFIARWHSDMYYAYECPDRPIIDLLPDAICVHVHDELGMSRELGRFGEYDIGGLYDAMKPYKNFKFFAKGIWKRKVIPPTNNLSAAELKNLLGI